MGPEDLGNIPTCFLNQKYFPTHVLVAQIPSFECYSFHLMCLFFTRQHRGVSEFIRAFLECL